MYNNIILEKQNKMKKIQLIYFIQKSINLINKLKLLFARMIYSNRKYIDPSEVLNAISDDFGKYIKIGD